MLPIAFYRMWLKMIAVRYADDSVPGLSFHHALEARPLQLTLTLHPEKTRLLWFGWFAVSFKVRVRI